jgi:hypothetical protein
MPKLFKSFSSISALGVLLYFIFNSCTEQNLSSTSTVTNEKNTIQSTTNQSVNISGFSSSVGAPIDSEKATRWMNNFKNSNKVEAGEYIIPVSILKSILNNTACVGVIFYYAVDDSKGTHIIPIGVDGTGKVISWNSIALENKIIDWQTARNWIDNYSGSMRAHFFGSQIIASTYFETKNMRISRAINDSGVPQLLLSNGDVATPQSYSDESGGCPPFCPTNN